MNACSGGPLALMLVAEAGLPLGDLRRGQQHMDGEGPYGGVSPPVKENAARVINLCKVVHVRL